MLEPIAFRIIVKPDALEKEKRSVGGIIIADMDSEADKKAATIRGTIVAIGPDAWKAYRPSQEFAGLKVGDRVYYAKYAGKMVRETEDGDDYFVMNDEDIVCKIVEDVK